MSERENDDLEDWLGRARAATAPIVAPPDLLARVSARIDREDDMVASSLVEALLQMRRIAWVTGAFALAGVWLLVVAAGREPTVIFRLADSFGMTE